MIVVLESVTKVGIRIVIVFKTAAAVLFLCAQKGPDREQEPAQALRLPQPSRSEQVPRVWRRLDVTGLLGSAWGED